MRTPTIHAAQSSFLEKTLLRYSSGSVGAFFRRLKQEIRDYRCDITYDHGAAVEHWWHLARLGVIAIAGEDIDPGVDNYRLTEHGKRLLENPQASLHDRRGYLAAICGKVGHPDAIAMSYIEEAIGAWESMLYRACVVMTGCACERLVLIMAEAVANGDVAPFSDKIRQCLSGKGGRPSPIATVFDCVRDALSAQADDRKLPLDIADGLDRTLTPIFERARGLRNKMGHPTGALVSSNDAEAGLLLFPDFYVLAESIRRHYTST